CDASRAPAVSASRRSIREAASRDFDRNTRSAPATAASTISVRPKRTALDPTNTGSGAGWTNDVRADPPGNLSQTAAFSIRDDGFRPAPAAPRGGPRSDPGVCGSATGRAHADAAPKRRIRAGGAEPHRFGDARPWNRAHRPATEHLPAGEPGTVPRPARRAAGRRDAGPRARRLERAIPARARRPSQGRVAGAPLGNLAYRRPRGADRSAPEERRPI